MLYSPISFAELKKRLKTFNVTLSVAEQEDSLCYFAEDLSDIVGYCITTYDKDGSYFIRSIKFYGERERLVREYSTFLRYVYEDLNQKNKSLKMIITSFRSCRPYSIIVDTAGLSLRPVDVYHFDLDKVGWKVVLERIVGFMRWNGYYVKSFSSLSPQESEMVTSVSSALPQYLQAIRGYEDEFKDISVCAFDNTGTVCGWGLSYIRNDYLAIFNTYCRPEFRKDCVGLFLYVSMERLCKKIGIYDSFSRILLESYDPSGFLFRMAEKGDSKIHVISEIIVGKNI